jgi:hypothetical protein
LQYAEHAGLLTSFPTVEEVLDNHASELGHDLIAYRNHVYRVVNLCLAIVGHSRVELEKIAVAAVFHDLGIWTNKTFDYIAPSVAIAREHLAARGMADWIPEIEAMIVDHHKVTTSRAITGRIISACRLDRRDARVTKVRPPAFGHRGCRRHVAGRRLSSTARRTDD